MELNKVANDLLLTVRELSNAYEELSLLYRIPELFASLSIDEICTRIIDETVNTLEVNTAAILFLNEETDRLYTKAFRGNWDCGRQFKRDDSIIWRSINTKKPSAFCRIKETEFRDYIPNINSVLICPINGKKKNIGAIVAADKTMNEEFYSYDTKLIMAIAGQAGLAIENALLYRELEALLIGAIRSLVKVLEATSYWTAGHTERVTEYAIGIGNVMRLDNEEIEKLKICSLLHDIGKIATPKEILNKNCKLNETEWKEIRKHPEVGAEILSELAQFKDIILGIKYHHEHWDGKSGIFGLKHEEIPIMARILSVADTFDALTSDRPYRPKKSREEAIKEIERCSGTQFDPEIVKAFLIWVNRRKAVQSDCAEDKQS